MKNKGFGHLKIRLFTISTSKNVGVGAHGIFTSPCFLHIYFGMLIYKFHPFFNSGFIIQKVHHHFWNGRNVFQGIYIYAYVYELSGDLILGMCTLKGILEIMEICSFFFFGIFKLEIWTPKFAQYPFSTKPTRRVETTMIWSLLLEW